MSGNRRYEQARVAAIRSRQPDQRRAPQPVSDLNTSIWPEIRVVRKANWESRTLNAGWGMFLDEVGDKNYGLGKAHTLGSVTLVFIKAQDMGRMLQDKYARAYADPRKTKELHHKIATSIHEFMRQARNKPWDAVSPGWRDAAAKDIYHQAHLSAGLSDAPKALSIPTSNRQSLLILPSEERRNLQRTQRLFELAAFTVKEVRLFGKDGYGLDLTPNDQLYDERDALVRHLRQNESLRVGNLANDGWQPHATMFTLEEHIRVTNLVHDAPPEAMAFDAACVR